MKRYLFIAVLVAQAAWMVGTAWVQEHALATGRLILLETQPVDPRDLLRGDYVILNYTISSIAGERFRPPRQEPLPPGQAVYVLLEPKGEFHEVAAASTEPLNAAGRQVVLRGTSAYRWNPSRTQAPTRVDYGLERYYVKEGTGNPVGKLTVRVSVPASGRGLIKQLLVAGVPYAEATARAREAAGPAGDIRPGSAAPPSGAPPAGEFRFRPDAVAARPPEAAREWIDLTAHYNAVLTNRWLPGADGIDLALLPRGTPTLDGVRFDVRGLIQLSGGGLPRERFPRQANGIAVGLRCAQLHFLQGCASAMFDGGRVANVIVHYADGQRATVPMVYGENVGDWRTPKPIANGTVAWSGTNQAGAVGLYRCVWANPRPTVEIARLDYVSMSTGAAPFLVAITAEPAGGRVP